MTRRLQRRPAAAAALACLMLAMPASRPQAQSADPQRILSSIPAEVLFLRATGAWSGAERQGTSRIVILRTGSPDGAQRLFVQWLADDGAGSPRIVAAEEVPEVFDWRIGIEDYRVEPEANGARVAFDARIIGTGQTRRYLLTIGPPGEVLFSALR